MSPRSTSCAGFIVISGVAVYIKYHVRGVEGQFGVRVCGTIVEELEEFLLGVHGWLILFGSKGAQCYVECTVHGPGIR